MGIDSTQPIGVAQAAGIQKAQGVTAAERAARGATGGEAQPVLHTESTLDIRILPGDKCPPGPWPRPYDNAEARRLVDSVLEAPDRASQMKAFANFVKTVESPFTSKSMLKATRDLLIERMASEGDEEKRQIAAVMLKVVDRELEKRGGQYPSPFPHPPFPDPPGPYPFPDPLPWPPQPKPSPFPGPWPPQPLRD